MDSNGSLILLADKVNEQIETLATGRAEEEGYITELNEIQPSSEHT